VAEADQAALTMFPETEGEGDLASRVAALTPTELQARIVLEVQIRFRYALPAGWNGLRRMATLRAVCKSVGIQLHARPYAFSPSQGVVGLCAADVAAMVPLVKAPRVKSRLVEHLRDNAQCMLSNGDELGLEAVVEALNVAEQVYGTVHPEVGELCANLAVALFQAGDAANAIVYQRKAVICSERVRGFDDADTLQQFISLAYFEHAAGNGVRGLRYMHHVLSCWAVLMGEGAAHPQTASALSTSGTICSKLGLHEEACKMFEASLKMNGRLLGPDHPMTVMQHESLVTEYQATGRLRESLTSAKAVYHFCKAQRGEGDEKTRGSYALLQSLTTQCVAQARAAAAAAALAQ
jgi:protein TIF31